MVRGEGGARAEDYEAESTTAGGETRRPRHGFAVTGPRNLPEILISSTSGVGVLAELVALQHNSGLGAGTFLARGRPALERPSAWRMWIATLIRGGKRTLGDWAVVREGG